MTDKPHNTCNRQMSDDSKWVKEFLALGRKIQDSIDDDTYQELLYKLAIHFDSDRVMMALIDDGEIIKTYSCHFSDPLTKTDWIYNSDLFNKTFKTKKTQLINANKKYKSTAYCQMFFPILSEKNLISVIGIGRESNVGSYRETDLCASENTIDIMGLLIENILLNYKNKAKQKSLEKALEKLESAKNQLIQSEKMASIGQLAAGVAHEINNPVGYINSNISSLNEYVRDFLELLDVYEQSEKFITNEECLFLIKNTKKNIGIEFIKSDIKSLISESIEGVARVKKIVSDLKDFSRSDHGSWETVDLRTCLDGAISIAYNEIKYKGSVHKEYADIEEIECISSQLNQVFLNLIVNAAQALNENGHIYVRAYMRNTSSIVIEVEDTGEGILPENIEKIFDPFFTTKPIGQGTGLGLSISYGIVQRHNGTLSVTSEKGKGTIFTVELPIKRCLEDDCIES